MARECRTTTEEWQPAPRYLRIPCTRAYIVHTLTPLPPINCVQSKHEYNIYPPAPHVTLQHHHHHHHHQHNNHQHQPHHQQHRGHEKSATGAKDSDRTSNISDLKVDIRAGSCEPDGGSDGCSGTDSIATRIAANILGGSASTGPAVGGGVPLAGPVKIPGEYSR